MGNPLTTKVTKVLHKGHKALNHNGFSFVLFVPSLCALWLKRAKSQ
jgi:hypothetical protein